MGVEHVAQHITQTPDTGRDRMMKIDEATSDYAATELTTIDTTERLRWMAQQGEDVARMAREYANAPDDYTDANDALDAAFGIGDTRPTKAALKGYMDSIIRDLAAHLEKI